MPIKECTLPEGGKGWQWGDHGKCYADRSEAEKQAAAAHANGFTGDSLAFDRATVRRIDEDGRLHVAITNISKANVCPYIGREIPDYDRLGLDPDKIYQLLRDPEELAKAAPTFNNIPLLLLHVPVTAEDYRPELVVGSTGTDAEFVAPYLKNSLVVWSADAIKGIESDEQRELSCAYRYVPDMTPGVYEGTPYDGVMRELRGNHVALVEDGRAGPDVIVGDSILEINPMKTKLSRKAVLAKGALTAFLKPKLATDAKLDLVSLLAGITSQNWKSRKAALVSALTAASKGKLAADANLDDVTGFLDSLDSDDGIGEDEEDKTALDADEPLSEEEEKQFQALLKRRKPQADDEDETEEEKKKKAEAEAQAKKDEKTAMDAALKSTEQKTVERMLAIREAERIVRPHIGDLQVAMDSASSIYKLALDHAGVDLTNVHESAYAAMVKMLPVDGPAKPKLAVDNSIKGSVAKKFPDAMKLKSV